MSDKEPEQVPSDSEAPSETQLLELLAGAVSQQVEHSSGFAEEIPQLQSISPEPLETEGPVIEENGQYDHPARGESAGEESESQNSSDAERGSHSSSPEVEVPQQQVDFEEVPSERSESNDIEIEDASDDALVDVSQSPEVTEPQSKEQTSQLESVLSDNESVNVQQSPEIDELQSKEQTSIPEIAQAQNQEVNEIIEIDSQKNKPFEVAKDTPGLSESVEQTPVRSFEKAESLGEIDTSSVSSFFELDPSVITSLDESVLQKLQLKVKEYADLKSEKTLLEVNLEQSAHANSKKIDLFKNQLQHLRSERKGLTEKNQEVETLNHELTKKLQQLESLADKKSSDYDNIQTRVESILSEERKTLELLEKKNSDIERLKNDYNEIQQSNSDLRKSLIALETTNQSLDSSYNQSKLKIQSLENQLELLNKNHEWLNSEFKSINDQFASYRSEKSAQISSLQSQFDGSSTELSSLKSRYDNLKSNFDKVSKNLDDSLLQIKSLTDEKSLNQEEFIKETSVKDRLVELLKKSNEDYKEKVKYLEETLEKSNSGVANETAQLKVTLEEYRTKYEQSEAKISQLEGTIDELTQVSGNASFAGNDSFHSLPRLSPSAKSTASKYDGVSLSQLYADFTLVKRQLVQERRSKERIQQQIDSFVKELEQKAPLINATRERVSLLENELTNLSIVLETTSKEKESLQKTNAELTGKISEYELTMKTLNKQKVDLAHQIQTLLAQISIRGDSNGPLTPLEKQAIQRISNGEKVINESDTDKLISERLVTFQNIVELQTKNEELLRIIRDLGSKLEKEERTSKSRLENLESSAINEAKEAILTLQEEISSIEVKLNSVSRERDMFRSMLANKNSTSTNILTGDLSSDASANESHKNLRAKYEQSQKELTDVQQNLQQVKVEAETTISILNKQITDLTNERYQLSIDLTREKSTAALTQERYKALQDNFKFSKSEAENLREKSQKLQESLTRQDLKTQQVANELIQSKSLIESLRAESNNLKAEKQLWSSVEKRLSHENSELVVEKVKLNSLVSNLQMLEKEREQNAFASQSRLIKQAESLEVELGRLRSQLSDTQAELKDVYHKKDTDSKAYQSRIDSLSLQLNSAEQAISQKENQITSLTKKAEILKSKADSIELKLKEYERLSNLTSSTTSSSESSSNSALVSEAIKSKKELEDAKAELDEAYKNVENFKKIAQSSEDALRSINESFDNYKSTTSVTVSGLQSENGNLTERITILNEQLENLNNELNETKSASAKELESTKSQINTLSSQLAETDKLKSDYDSKVALIEDSYKQQVAITNEAQSNYDKELQKHAEVSRAISLLRQESSELKEQIQKLSSESKQYKNELVKSQESWDSQKTILEEELRVANARVQDLSSQNHILYNQIESLTKRSDDSSTKDVNTEDTSNDELRELITLLRREKEISDSQLDVTTRDLRRVRQQLEIANTELDKTRLELAKSSQRESEASNLSQEHAMLLQEINQLNLLRESNVTLRNELTANVARVKELESNLDALNGRIEPFQSEIAGLKAEIAHKSQELKLITEEKERWKQRSQDILSKYDRIDPSEHETLKKQLEEANVKIKELEEKLSAEHEKLTRLRSQSQKIINTKSEERKEVQRLYNEAKEALKKLEDSSTAELEKVQAESKDKLERLTNEIKETKDKLSKLSQKNNNNKAVETLNNQLKENDTELEKAKEFEKKFNDLTATKDKLEATVAELKKEVEDLKKRLSSTPAPANNEESDKIRDELNAERKQLESLKDELAKQKEEAAAQKSAAAPANTDSAELLKEQEAKLREEFEKDKKAAISVALEDLKSRVRGASAERLNELAEVRTAKVKKELEEEYKKKIDALEQRLKNSNKKNSTDQDLEKVKQESFTSGRDAALKEVAMRTKLLQSKIDKLTKERNQLLEKISSSTNDSQSNDQVVKPSETKESVPGPAPTESKPVNFLPVKPALSEENNPLKRPNEEDAGSIEKKTKSD
jgi:nucleoprotein TPR